MSFTVSRKEYSMMTYLPLYLIANKTVELVHENISHYFDMKKNKNTLWGWANPLGIGQTSPSVGNRHFSAFGASILAPSALDPSPCFF